MTFEVSGVPPGTLWLQGAIFEPKSTNIIKLTLPFWGLFWRLWATFGCLFLRRFFDTSPEGLLGDFWAQKVQKWSSREGGTPLGTTFRGQRMPVDSPGGPEIYF